LIVILSGGAAAISSAPSESTSGHSAPGHLFSCRRKRSCFSKWKTSNAKLSSRSTRREDHSSKYLTVVHGSLGVYSKTRNTAVHYKAVELSRSRLLAGIIISEAVRRW
ncbi:unnamed protein product, partial [Ectocarpus sp. 13 AM-2016]